jgi:hypothetical protein
VGSVRGGVVETVAPREALALADELGLFPLGRSTTSRSCSA